jgi:N-acetylneuraminic acid mutarotase
MILNKKFTFAFLFLLYFSTIQAQPWFEKSNFGGTARHRASSFSIGNFGYIGLGHINSGVDVEYEDFWKYDPSSDTWTQIANYPNGKCYHATSFVIGNLAYVGGGRLENGSYTKKFYSYDPVTNVWTPIADLLGAARRGAVGFAINGKGYVGTGQTTTGYAADFYEYNPLANTWTAKANFPGAGRTSAVGFSIDQFGYLGTGNTNMGSTNDFYQYRPDINQWVLKAPVGPITRQEAVGFAVNGMGYIGTGDDFSSGNNYGDFWEYEVLSNTWVQIEDFAGTARRYLTSFVIGTRAYVGTGTNGTNFRDFWMFDQILSVLKRKLYDFDVSLYPNPSVDFINIDLLNIPNYIPISSFKFELFNLNGQLFKSEQLESNQTSIRIDQLNSGNYIYRLVYDGQTVKIGKFVKS